MRMFNVWLIFWWCLNTVVIFRKNVIYIYGSPNWDSWVSDTKPQHRGVPWEGMFANGRLPKILKTHQERFNIIVFYYAVYFCQPSALRFASLDCLAPSWYFHKNKSTRTIAICFTDYLGWAESYRTKFEILSPCYSFQIWLQVKQLVSRLLFF